LPERFESILTADLMSEAEPPKPPSPHVSAPRAETHARLIVPLAAISPNETIERVGDSISSDRPPDVDRTAAIVGLGGALASRGVDVNELAWFSPTTEEIVECFDTEGLTILSDWLATKPAVAQAIDVAVQVANEPTALRAFETWSKAESGDARTQLLIALVS